MSVFLSLSLRAPSITCELLGALAVVMMTTNDKELEWHHFVFAFLLSLFFEVLRHFADEVGKS